MVHKNEIIELIGVAMIAGENAFLLGPPGTGKSAIVGEWSRRLDGRFFDYLLTQFTEPSELFGPFDLRRLREGELVTNTVGMLPEADIVFLDELLNANSAILNSLLLALNEKVFRRGTETAKLPMLLAVGASNRLPEDEALAALFDRFLLRVVCENVADEGLESVLDAGWNREAHRNRVPDVKMSLQDVKTLAGFTEKVDLSSVRAAYLDLIRRLRSAGMPLSDRRAVRLQRVVAASAILCGRLAARVSDLWVMSYVWDNPAQSEWLGSTVNAVIDQYGDSSKEASSGPKSAHGDDHPMSGRNADVDAEAIADAIEAVVQEDSAIRADRLTMLAAKSQWVSDDEQRRQLESMIETARRKLLTEAT